GFALLVLPPNGFALLPLPKNWRKPPGGPAPKRPAPKRPPPGPNRDAAPAGPAVTIAPVWGCFTVLTAYAPLPASPTAPAPSATTNAQRPSTFGASSSSAPITMPPMRIHVRNDA